MGYLFLKIDSDMAAYTPGGLHSLRPRDNCVLRLSIEHVSNDNIGLASVVIRPRGIDRWIMRFDLIDDDVAFVH